MQDEDPFNRSITGINRITFKRILPIKDRYFSEWEVELNNNFSSANLDKLKAWLTEQLKAWSKEYEKEPFSEDSFYDDNDEEEVVESYFSFSLENLIVNFKEAMNTRKQESVKKNSLKESTADRNVILKNLTTVLENLAARYHTDDNYFSFSDPEPETAISVIAYNVEGDSAIEDGIERELSKFASNYDLNYHVNHDEENVEYLFYNDEIKYAFPY